MILKHDLMNKKMIISVLSIALFCFIFYSFNAFADNTSDLGFDIGGTDKSGMFPTLINFLHTVAVFAVQYIARIIGACLCIYGLFTAAMKDKIAGIVAIGFGAVLLFLPTILQQFIKFGTGT